MTVWLVMKTRDGQERPFALRDDRMVIGSESRCDVRIAVPSVSGQHCELRLDGRELKLQALDDSRTTLHNGEPISAGDRAVLAHADTVTVGPVTFEVRLERTRSNARGSGASGASGAEVKPIVKPQRASDREASE